MSNKEVARKIVLGYINGCYNLSFEDKLVEIASVTEDDGVLLEHITIMIEVLEKAKKEIEEKEK